MNDNPSKPEFATWVSYQNFAEHVRHGSRYVWREEVQAFLDTVIATLRDRDVNIVNGRVFFRARLGVEYVDEVAQGVVVGKRPSGYDPRGMKPLRHAASEGRANPVGIPVLYLASTEKTAISEVRPWIGSEVSVAQLKTTRNLRLLDLSRGHGKNSMSVITFPKLFGEVLIKSEDKEAAVWIDIDNAFSEPVTRSDGTADYVPTQILAELFQRSGYDGIVYRSQFGTNGYNVALFSLDDADVINCAPYRVSAVDIEFKETGDRWYIK